MPHRTSRSSLRAAVVAAVAGGLLLAAGPALAHVTVRTDNSDAGGFAKYTVRVPNERDDSGTVKVEVQMPEGLDASRYQPLAGWDITLADGVLTAEGNTIEPGQFQEFSFSARNPDEPGELAFPAIQTYASGEEVSWTGEPDSDTPASVVEIVEASGDGHGGGGDDHEGAGADAGATEAEAALAPGESASAARPAGDALVYVAIGLGGVALLVAGGALLSAKRA